MKKSELLARIVELERQVRELQARPVYVPLSPTYPAPPWGDNFPGTAAPFVPPYVVTCSALTLEIQ